jgi:hypothetical protein
MRNYIGVGLLILSISFPVSLFGGFGVVQSLAETRIVDVLMAHPERYLYYARDAFLFMILVPAVGLAVSVIAFAKEVVHPTGVFDKLWLSLTIFGGFFVFWGAYGFLRTTIYYLECLERAQWVNMYGSVPYSSVNIAEPLHTVYVAVSVGCILWLFGGIIFTFSPILKIMLRKKNTPTIT